LQEEQNLLLDLQEKKRNLDYKIETLTEMLEELGILDLHKQLESLKEQINEWQGKAEGLRDFFHKIDVNQARCEERLKTKHEQYERKQTELHHSMNQWGTEWQRGLLPEWKETRVESGETEKVSTKSINDQECFKNCQSIFKYYRKTYEQKTKEAMTNACLDVF